MDAAWEELRRHHAGEWHGEWSELGAGGEAAPAWLALTSVRFEEDSGACVISRQVGTRVGGVRSWALN